jgi:dipeptidase E
MKLFLASFAHKTLDKVRSLLPDSPDKLRVAFVPTAADPYEDKEFVRVDRDKLTSMGFSVTDVDIKNQTEQELEKLLQPFDVIAVAGGNTYYLLYHAQKSGFLKIVKQRISQGVVYIGSSAGSILACPTIDAARLFDPSSIVPDLIDFRGMGLVDFLVIPHFDTPRYQERMRRTVEEWSGKNYHLYPLTDQQAVVLNNGQVEFVDAADGD